MSKTIGRFEILRTLGTGASCKVKLGLDTDTGRKVAVKIINDNMDPKMKELVITEVAAMAKIQHENVIH
jgi:serine/threonine protein kinase